MKTMPLPRDEGHGSYIYIYIYIYILEVGKKLHFHPDKPVS